MTTPVSRNPKRQRKKEGHQARRAAELEALRRQRRNRMIVRFALVAGLILAIAVVLSVVGGGDDDGDDVASDDTTDTSAEDGSTTTSEPEAIDIPNLTCEPATGENTDTSSAPTVTVPEAPARDLTCTDLVVGTGEEVPDGATVLAHYTGVSQSTGEQFDSSWEGGEPIEFSLTGVIAGWTQGIPGMKVGGRRELVIPGEMAYGAQGNPSAGIPPDDTLVFVVDIIDIVE